VALAVKFDFDDPVIAEVLGGGASAAVAIYSQTARPVHILGKVIMRIGPYTN